MAVSIYRRLDRSSAMPRRLVLTERRGATETRVRSLRAAQRGRGGWITEGESEGKSEQTLNIHKHSNN